MRISDWSSDVCSSDLPAHPFAIAQGLVPGSYVPLESELDHHGWIPEAVFVTASVSPGGKRLSFATADFGTFSFHPLAIKDYRFLTGVGRNQLGKLTAVVAHPPPADLELVAHRENRWDGLAGQ